MINIYVYRPLNSRPEKPTGFRRLSRLLRLIGEVGCQRLKGAVLSAVGVDIIRVRVSLSYELYSSEARLRGHI